MTVKLEDSRDKGKESRERLAELGMEAEFIKRSPWQAM
jgi:hypothetical protein